MLRKYIKILGFLDLERRKSHAEACVWSERTMRGWDRAVTMREQEAFKRARLRLLGHAALEHAPELPSLQSPTSLDEVPRPVLRGLFDDLVRRTEKGAEIARVRSVGRATPDSLRDLWDATREKGHDPGQLCDRKTLKQIVIHPVDEPLSVPGGKAVENALWHAQSSIRHAKSYARKLALDKLLDKSAGTGGTHGASNAEMREHASSLSGAGTAKDYLDRATNKNVTGDTRAPSTEPCALPSAEDGGSENVVELPFQLATPNNSADNNVRTVAGTSRRKGAASAGAISGPLALSATRVGASECCFCPDPALFGNLELKSELLGPFVNARGRAALRVHFECACWAPQVYVDNATGRFHHVYDEYLRGRHLRCGGCGGRGATVGCYVEKCKKAFHFRCLGRANARRVDKFFVAFCRTHAHLVDKESYQLMMEAATIADVASSRRDITYGLDTPHSKYTLLRRSESELIFSARAGISSHAGAFDATKVVFSTRRRAVITPAQKLTTRDRPRRVRASALDVATGRLALLSLGQVHESSKNPTAVEASAAVASKKYAAVFLLRNLEQATDYAPDDIIVTKSNSRGSRASMSPATNAASGSRGISRLCPRKRILDSIDKTEKAFGRGVPMFSGPAVTGWVREDQIRAVSAHDRCKPSRMQKLSKPAGVMSDSALSDKDLGATTDASTGVGSPKIRRVILRVPLREEAVMLVKERRLAEDGELREEQEANARREQKRRDREVRAKRRRVKEDKLRHRACKVAGIGPDTHMLEQPNQTAIPKVRSAWEIFLDEQLLKERTLRPEDSIEVAMRNMACLWGLLLPHERAVYEERAKQSVGLSLPGDTSIGPCHIGPAANQSLPVATVQCTSDVVKAAAAAAVATDKVRGTPLAHMAPSPLANNDMRIATRLSNQDQKLGFEHKRLQTPTRITRSQQHIIARNRGPDAAGERLREREMPPIDDSENCEEQQQNVGLFKSKPKDTVAESNKGSHPGDKVTLRLPASTLGPRPSRSRSRGGVGSLRLRDCDWDDLFPVDINVSSGGVRPPPPRRA